GRLLTSENAIDIAGGAAVLVDNIIPIGDQAPAVDKVASEVDGGQSVPSRKRDDQIAINARKPARRHDQTAIRRPRECREGALDLIPSDGATAWITPNWAG